MFDFKELEAFVWVVRLGSFRKGATKLHLTQPSISDRINRLEAAVGESLLERATRPIQPTLRGREFFAHAERLLSGRDEAMRLFQEEGAFSGTLRLGVIETIANSWFPAFMRQLAERYPKLTLEMTVDISPCLHQRLADNDLDMLFAMDSAAMGPYATQTPLCTFEMGMFASPSLARQLAEDGARFATTPFISFSKQARPYTELVSYLSEQGITQPKVHCTSTLMTILRMSSEGLGIGVLPVATVEDVISHGELVRLPLETPLPPMIYEAIWRNANYPDFCASVARLGRQCAETYSRQHVPANA